MVEEVEGIGKGVGKGASGPEKDRLKGLEQDPRKERPYSKEQGKQGPSRHLGRSSFEAEVQSR